MFRAITLVALLLALLAPSQSRAGSVTEFGLVAGHPRNWLVHLPSHYKRGQPLPLVIMYHDKGMAPAGLERTTDLDSLADRMHFIAVYPAALGGTWAVQGYGAVDDLSFTAGLLDQMELKFSVDPQRVVLAGFAQGAQMVNLLGCRLADRVSGIVVVAGTLSPDLAKDCHPSRPLTVVEFHASADRWVPFVGGSGPKGGGNGMGVEANVAGWATRDGCKATPAKTQLPGTDKFPSAQIEDFAGCPNGTQVRLYEIMGNWHLWFRGDPVDADVVIGELVVDRRVH